MPAGRPTIYTPELGDKICKRLAEGDSLNKISKDPDMPDRSTMIAWALSQVKDAEEFTHKYALARQIQQEALADEIHDIADDSSRDKIDDDGKVTIDYEHIQRSKLRVDTRKWYLSAIVPRFKPKSETTHGLTDELSKLLAEIDSKEPGLPDGNSK